MGGGALGEGRSGFTAETRRRRRKSKAERTRNRQEGLLHIYDRRGRPVSDSQLSFEEPLMEGIVFGSAVVPFSEQSGRRRMRVIPCIRSALRDTMPARISSLCC